MKILIVEDDENLAKSISATFKKMQMQSDLAVRGEFALEFLDTYSYDLILLDVMLPDTNGFELLKSFRKNGVDTPVLILSSLADHDNKIEGFNQGADDYLTKPFNREELIARVNAIVRRSKGYAHSSIKISDLEINLSTKQAFVENKPVPLTSKEYSVLEILALKKGKPVSKEHLLDQLYGGISEPEPKIIDVFVCKIRDKIKKITGKNYIKTIWGQGYLISDLDEE
ncbi:MAG: response regulator transcription factor [Alphaproteobacteria bacterium]|jgi:two-component system cell cycle response regulator CtrA|nr:response regulator transcription factor [Alphaproteobacteria bacterium]